MGNTTIGDDGIERCSWSSGATDYIEYHDKEWGYPVKDDIRLFEKLCLESFQSGLSWRTILSKREGFRQAFKGFDFNVVAEFTAQDVQNLLLDKGIVRHRGKIEAVINNAKCAQKIVEEVGSLAAFFWQFEPETELPEPQIPSETEESRLLSKTLKKKGWKFVGPTTVYAFMQAMGLVNDHAVGCKFRELAHKARLEFKKPV